MSKSTIEVQRGSRLADVLTKHESAILEDWVRRQLAASTRRADLIRDTDLRQQSQSFLRVLTVALQAGEGTDTESPAWAPVREQIAALSSARARQGFAPSDTAMFVFSLKEPLFAYLGRELDGDFASFEREAWTATAVLDRLGLFTIEVFVRTREEVIARQQSELLELSTPVVTLWHDILALPLIGTLDSARTQIVMESLLHRIVETGSRIAILDITGVPTVDTLVAQHLLKTVAAARLMGADCLISGIRPQIAQTIVHLGVELGHVTTKASLREAFAVALERTNQRIVEVEDESPPSNGRASADRAHGGRP